jgi:hypothetical protein
MATPTALAGRSRRPPVEHRFLGLDRRTFKFAIPVIALAVFWIFVIPGVDHLLKNDDPIEAGDELLVAPGVTFTPTTGWNLEEGLRTTERTRSKAVGRPVLLTNGAITMRVSSGPFKGEPSELIEQIDKESTSFAGKESFNVSGDEESIPIPGAAADAVIEGYSAPGSEGVVGAYVFGGTGVKVDAVGPIEQISEHSEEISEMLGSFAYEPETAEP